MNSKAQLQTQETILVLFIVVVIILLGIAFFLRYQRQSILDERTTYERTQFQHMILTLPEDAAVRCSRFGQKENCVDTLKILAAAPFFQNDPDRYGTMNITFTQLYPAVPSVSCTTGTLTDCGVWTLYTQRPEHIRTTLKTVTPLSLYRPESDHYVLGLLTIERYTS